MTLFDPPLPSALAQVAQENAAQLPLLGVASSPEPTIAYATEAAQSLWGGDPSGEPLARVIPFHAALDQQGTAILVTAQGVQLPVLLHPFGCLADGVRALIVLPKTGEEVANRGGRRFEARPEAQARSAFFATMAHQLRTPMNAIIGFSELLSNPDLRRVSATEVQEYGNHIHEAASNLLRILNDVLYLSRIDAGLLEIDPTPVSLRPELEVLLRQVDHVVQDKGLTIQLDIDAAADVVVVDARYFRHMLQHLLQTSVRSSPRGAEVLIRTRPGVSGGAMISLRDEGQGLSSSQLAQIMDPLSVGSFDYAQETLAGGLGLSIIKGLAEMHGGRFEVISRPGHGCSYHLAFPERVGYQRAQTLAKSAGSLVENPV